MGDCDANYIKHFHPCGITLKFKRSRQTMLNIPERSYPHRHSRRGQVRELIHSNFPSPANLFLLLG